MRTINDIFAQGQEAKARVRELYELIQGEVNEEANLDALNTTSKTSIWSLWIYIFAALSWLLEGVFQAFKTETVQIIDASIAGTDRWQSVDKFGEPLTYGVQGLDPEQTVQFRVYAVNAQGTGPVSDGVTVAEGQATSVLDLSNIDEAPNRQSSAGPFIIGGVSKTYTGRTFEGKAASFYFISDHIGSSVYEDIRAHLNTYYGI